MARTGIEFKDVERTARRLFSQGITPSVQKIRNVLGTGSNTTIARHLKTWQESFSESRSPTLPESVPEALMDPLDDFWSTAVAKAESNYQKYKEELEAKLSAMDAERLQAIDHLELQTQKNALLTRELEEVQTALRELEGKLNTIEGENGILQNDLGKSHQMNEQMIVTVKDQQQSFDATLLEMRVANQEELNNVQDYSEKAENRPLVEIDQLRQTIKKSESEEKELRNSNVRKIDALQHREAEQQTDLYKLHQEIERITTESLQANKNAAQATGQIVSLQSQLNQALDTITSFNDKLGQVNKTEVEIAEQISDLRKSISVFHNDIKENANEHSDKN